jgi:hypothetical protein
MQDYMKALARKGDITVLEHGRKTIVALQLGAGVVTLEGATGADQLVAELYQMCKHWPDRNEKGCGPGHPKT